MIERVLIDNKIVFDVENAQVKHFSFGADTDPERLEVTWTDSVLSVNRGPKGNAGDSFSITMQDDKKNLGKSIFDIPDDIVLAQMLNFGMPDKHRYRYGNNNLIAYTVSEGGCDYILHYYIVNDYIDVYRSEYQGENYNSYGGFRIDGKIARISGASELYSGNPIVDFINRCIVYNFDLYVVLYPFVSM